jgi:hypothetical protein
LDTFAEPREFVEDSGYVQRRRQTLSALDLGTIDAPIRDLVGRLAGLPHCFTLQSCYGHFLYEGQRDPHGLGPLPTRDVGQVRFRMAYLALCLRGDEDGRRFRRSLRELTEIDPQYVQFGSAEWFWRQHPNSYALQVVPERFKDRDEAIIQYAEAALVQKVRDQFFKQLREVVGREAAATGA